MSREEERMRAALADVLRTFLADLEELEQRIRAFLEDLKARRKP